MCNSVSSSNESQAYFASRYASTPINSENKIEHKIKKGENLWTIAKDHLGKKNASNAEISDMMYKIAKLNNKDSIEEINTVYVNDIIYLPGAQQQKKTSAAQTPQQAAEHAREVSQKINDIIVPQGSATYNQKALYKLDNLKNIPQSLYKEHAEAGVGYWDQARGDQDNKFIISKSTSYSPVIYTGLSVLKKENNNPYGKTEAHMYISVDKQGKVKDISFEVPGVNINEIGFDYKLDSNGNVYRHTGFRDEKLATLPPEQYENLIQQAQQYFDDNVK